MDQHIVKNYFTTVCGCSGERSSSSPAVSGVPQGSAHGSLMVYDTSRCTVAVSLLMTFSCIQCIEDYGIVADYRSRLDYLC